MTQTKTQSLIEAMTNTAVGFGISLAATFVIFPVLGIATTPSKNLLITLFFTAISITRGYVIRRWFDADIAVKKHKKQKDLLSKVSRPVNPEYTPYCQCGDKTASNYYQICADCFKHIKKV